MIMTASILGFLWIEVWLCSLWGQFYPVIVFLLLYWKSLNLEYQSIIKYATWKYFPYSLGYFPFWWLSVWKPLRVTCWHCVALICPKTLVCCLNQCQSHFQGHLPPCSLLRREMGSGSMFRYFILLNWYFANCKIKTNYILLYVRSQCFSSIYLI